MDRRAFLTTAAMAAAAGTRIGSATPATDRSISLTGTLPTRTLGRTGHRLPVLGMGGAVMQDKYAELAGVDTQSLEARVAMIRHGYERGLRYVDTARGYGESESIIGAALADVRNDIYLATKIWATKPEDVRGSVERSLKELKTDFLDAIQIHGPLLGFVGFDGAMGLHTELVKLRDEGMVRFIGLTGHASFELMHRLIATGGFDQLLIAYGYFHKGMVNLLSNVDQEWRNLCIAKAHELGMGIVAMKVMGGWVYGHAAGRVVPGYDQDALGRLPGAAIRWALSDPRISILNIGVCLPSDIDDNIATLVGDTTLTNDDRLLLADFSGRAYESPDLQNVLERAQQRRGSG
jgi:predicted aldo/keto reductase-like oxidoreductase